MKIICVNADGTTENRFVGARLHRIVDFERGKVWQEAPLAIDDKTSIPVYCELPWSSYSERSPKQQKEYEEACMRKLEAGGTL